MIHASTREELNIFIGGLAGLQKVYTIVRSDGPVVMLTGTVYSGKRLLMQHAAQTVLACHTLQSLHYQLVVIHCHIGRLVDGRHFMLCGSRLIMLGLGCYTQLPQLDIDIMHETTDTLTDNTEIVVIHLLSLGGGSTEQVRPAKIISSRCKALAESTRKYSCSAPTEGSTLVASVLPNRRTIRIAACSEPPWNEVTVSSYPVLRLYKNRML